MASTTTSTDTDALPSFEKHGKVSVWCSTLSYDTIPDSYFEEDEHGLDAWAKNFNISEYDHENMETNGVASGTAMVKQIIEECSYSSGYGEGVIHKINKMGHSEVSWIILLFDFEYRNKITKIHEDENVQYVGSFVYDMDAITLAEQDQFDADREEKLRIEAQLALDIAAAAELEATPAPAPAPAPQPVEPEVPKVTPTSNNPWLKS